MREPQQGLKCPFAHVEEERRVTQPRFSCRNATKSRSSCGVIAASNPSGISEIPEDDILLMFLRGITFCLPIACNNVMASVYSARRMPVSLSPDFNSTLELA